MSHFAEVDENNIVLRVLVGNDNLPNEGHDWFVANLGGTWIQTSYNTHGGLNFQDGGEPLRKNYAGIGYTFDGVGFASPTPYPSWLLDSGTYLWGAPTPMPTDGAMYSWNEDELSWEELVLPTE